MMNAAIYGFGRWGRTLVDAVQGKSEAIRFTAGVAHTPDRHRDYAAEKDLSLTGDYDAVLGDPAIDAVALATPHSMHAEHVRRAAAAGKHVYVEKPFTLTKASAEEAAKACADANVTLAVGFNRRFRPAFQDMKAMIAEGRIGDILHVESQHSGPTFYRTPADSWRAVRAENPAGGMAARGIHNLDLMIRLCGEIGAVCAVSERREVPIDVDDTTAMMFRFAGGATGYLGTSMATGNYWRIHVFGSAGWIEMRGEHALAVSDLDEVVEEKSYDPTDTIRTELEAFAAAAAGGEPYPVTPEEAVHGVAVHEAADRSARAGGGWTDVA